MNHQVSVCGFITKVIALSMALACSHIVNAQLISDDFNPATAEPNPAWRFFDPFNVSPNEDPNESSLTFDGTNAIIDVPGGQAHDLWRTEATNKAPRLLQSTPDTDFEFEVKFETTPNITNQLQGIVIQESDSVFLRYDVFSQNSGVRVFVAYVNGDTNSTTSYASIPLADSPNYRQVIRSGDEWTFRYSFDGVAWENINFTKNLAVTEVGVFTGNSGQNPSFLSSVDYFIDLGDPISDTDTWSGVDQSNAPPPVINIWYDNAQTSLPYGKLGIPQQQANVLGNVSTDINISNLSYVINDGEEQTLRTGPDTRRLHRNGDFNIEIDQASLNIGLNTIEIIATDSNDRVTKEIVTIDYETGNVWPIPYTADWGSLTNTQDVESVAHITDGFWELTPSGIRAAQTGYDRTITIGDMTWSTDYQVTTPITFNAGFAGVGIGIGWQGHDGVRTPKIEWPLQSLAWIRGPIDKATLEIITYGGLPTSTWENVVTPDPQESVTISPNITYMLKISSESTSNEMSEFSIKFWPLSESEPADWNAKAEIPTRKGSVLLVAHHADVTFGNISIEALSDEISDATPPVISNIKIERTGSTAVITWDTDEPSTSEITYGLDAENLDSTVNDNSLVTTHSVTVTDLIPNSSYSFQIRSTDASNNTSSSLLTPEVTAPEDITKECSMDADGNTKVDALTDGLLFIRYLLGLRGESLIENALADNCTNCTAAEVEPIIEQCVKDVSSSDVDGNGEVDALTDGLLVIRYLFDFRGNALIADSYAADCSRCTAVEIETHLQEMMILED